MYIHVSVILKGGVSDKPVNNGVVENGTQSKEAAFRLHTTEIPIIHNNLIHTPTNNNTTINTNRNAKTKIPSAITNTKRRHKKKKKKTNNTNEQFIQKNWVINYM
eukprot:490799_1